MTATTTPDSTPTTGYAPVNGLYMYYEIHGTGRPLVMIHGALATIDTCFEKTLPALAETRQVVAVELQAHGHTADVDRPLTFEQLADDTAALLRHLGIDKADFFGYSLGGAVALQLAKDHPDLVGKVVFAGGASFNPEGLYPELLAGMEHLAPEQLAGTPWEAAYAKFAPNPGDWPTLVAKIRDLDLAFEGWPPEDLQAVEAPVQLIIGDSDIVRPEHVVEMFRLFGGGVAGDLAGLPRSQLAILPGTTHVTVVDKADWLVSMITEFLDAPVPDASTATGGDAEPATD